MAVELKLQGKLSQNERRFTIGISVLSMLAGLGFLSMADDPNHAIQDLRNPPLIGWGGIVFFGLTALLGIFKVKYFQWLAPRAISPPRVSIYAGVIGGCYLVLYGAVILGF